MVRFLLNVGLLCLLAALPIGAQEIGLQEATRWRFDQRNLRAEPESTVTDPLTLSGRTVFVPGRRGQGLSLRDCRSPLNIPQAALGPGTWSLGFYARSMDLKGRARLLAWGKATVHYLDLLPDGRLEWGVEAKLGSNPPLQSMQRFGPQTWHHVALSVSPEETTVFLNGVRQGTFMAHSDPLEAPLQFAPRQGNLPPFGGEVDEMVALPYYTTEAAWSREEPYLIFRNIVLRDLKEMNFILNADELRAPTFEGTARLRRYVHRLFTAHAASTAPLDPLSIDWNDGGIESYVFSTAITADYGLSTEMGNLFLAIRSGQRTGYCGAASYILRGIYKAFGYEPRVRDFIHRNGRDTHVLAEVKVVETGQWVFQDPTYDLGGRSTLGPQEQFVGIDELVRYANRPNPMDQFPFEQPDMDFEGESERAWSFSRTGARFYLGYFHKQAKVYPPELH